MENLSVSAYSSSNYSEVISPACFNLSGAIGPHQSPCGTLSRIQSCKRKVGQAQMYRLRPKCFWEKMGGTM